MLDDITLEMYLDEIKRFKLLKPKEEKKVVQEYQEGSLDARKILIISNLRLVVNIAKRYIHCGMTLMDLIAEGNIGLIYAVERFDPAKGCRFSTYATFWIKHAICRALTEQNTLVRIPAYMKKILSDCKKKNEDLTKQLGHTPTVKEVIDILNLPRSKSQIVREAVLTNRALEGMHSLHNLQNYDNIEDISEKQAQNRIWDQSEVEWLMDILNSIEPKRAKIIKLRYGLDGNPTMTLKEIACELSLTKERIRQIEKETLKMLKDCLNRSNYVEREVSAFVVTNKISH